MYLCMTFTYFYDELEPFYGTPRTKDGPEYIGKDIDTESDPQKNDMRR